MTPLRRKLIEDMRVRNYSEHTIDGYVRYAAKFAKHFGLWRQNSVGRGLNRRAGRAEHGFLRPPGYAGSWRLT